MHDNVLNEDDIVDVLDEEVEEVEPNVGEHVPYDEMIGIDDIDDYFDMANPFNMNSKLDGTYDELYEEED